VADFGPPCLDRECNELLMISSGEMALGDTPLEDITGLGQAVLPRPDPELLVELALSLDPARLGQPRLLHQSLCGDSVGEVTGSGVDDPPGRDVDQQSRQVRQVNDLHGHPALDAASSDSVLPPGRRVRLGTVRPRQDTSAPRTAYQPLRMKTAMNIESGTT